MTRPKPRPRAGRTALALCVPLAFAAAPAAALPSYSLQALGDLPGGAFDSRANAINDLGQVVGSSDDGSGSSPFIWQAGVGMTAFADLPGGGDLSSAGAINNPGQVRGPAIPAARCMRICGRPAPA